MKSLDLSFVLSYCHIVNLVSRQGLGFRSQPAFVSLPTSSINGNDSNTLISQVSLSHQANFFLSFNLHLLSSSTAFVRNCLCLQTSDMATSVQSVSPQMRHYLSSCSPQELHAILQTIQGSQLTQSPPPNVMHNTQLQVAQPTQIAKVSKRKTTKVSVAKLKKRTRTRGGPFTTPATRPLNSYMAFRSERCEIFHPDQSANASQVIILPCSAPNNRRTSQGS